MKDIFKKYAKKPAQILGCTALALAFNFSAAANSNLSPSLKEQLPMPSFPASFADATYEGKRGCFPGDNRYEFAIAENEKMVLVGTHSVVETNKVSPHTLSVYYNAENDYGYTIARNGNSMRCVTETLSSFSFNDPQLATIDVTNNGPLNCRFEPSFMKICDRRDVLIGKLQSNGFKIDWSASRENGDVMTMMSGKGKSYILTTDNKSLATIVTGLGQGEFKEFQVDTTDPIIASNQNHLSLD